MLTFIFAVEPIFFSQLQYWSFLWLLHLKKKTFVVDLSRTLWSKKLLLWLGGWTNHLTVFTFLENTIRDFPLACHHLVLKQFVEMLTGVWQVRKKTLYFGIILPICGVPAETCSFLVFPLLVRLSCLTVHISGCPTAYGGVWLGSRFLWPLGRHPLWLPAWLMSLCLVFGVILNYCGAEFPMSPRV